MTWYTNQPLFPFGWSKQPEEIYVENRSDFAAIGREAIKYVPERTCTFSRGHNGNDTEKQELPRCSACGDEVDGYMCAFYADLGGDVVLEYPYRYCPNCGARVLDD